MPDESLFKAVQKFAEVTLALSDQDLERPWVWQDYEEGVRFSFFRTYEQLRQLAATLGTQRTTQGVSQTTPQRTLAQYHLAYRDLQAILFGVSDEQAQRAPAEGEWPLKEILPHIVQATRGFFIVTSLTLDRARASEEPRELNEEIWNTFWANDRYKHVPDDAPLSDVLAYYDELHHRIIKDLAGITEAELQLPSIYWESTSLPLQFRLHRFDSHLRQHTVQVEKTLLALEGPPSEARRLLRLIFAALAEAESAGIGTPAIGQVWRDQLAKEIEDRAIEIEKVV